MAREIAVDAERIEQEDCGMPSAIAENVAFRLQVMLNENLLASIRSSSSIIFLPFLFSFLNQHNSSAVSSHSTYNYIHTYTIYTIQDTGRATTAFDVLPVIHSYGKSKTL